MIQASPHPTEPASIFVKNVGLLFLGAMLATFPSSY